MMTETEVASTFECVNCTQSCALTNGNESSSFKLNIQNSGNDFEIGEKAIDPKNRESIAYWVRK